MARATPARRNPGTDQLGDVLIVGTLVWIAWPLLQNLLHRGSTGGTAPGAPSLSYSTGSSTSATQTSAPRITDPNFTSHATGWRQARVANGQDPNDWSAFRTFELQIGAPDPGGVPVVGWPNAFGTVGGQLPGGY